MQKALLVLIPLGLSIAAVAFVSHLFFKSLDITATIPQKENLTVTNQQDQNEKSDDEWIKSFAKQSKKGFEYPVTELQIKLDLLQQLKDQTVYRVVIDDLDEYKFFCINQVLKAKDIKYSYFRSKGYIKLIVTAKDEEYLKSVLLQLKEYNINYKIEQTLIKG